MNKIILLAILLTSVQSADLARLDSILPYERGSHHREDGTFQNNYIDRDSADKSFGDLWKMLRTERPEPYAQQGVPLNTELLKQAAPNGRVTWLGHSTFLIQLGSLNILTDPQFSERASPVQWAGPQRYTPLDFEVSQLPKIDYIVVSHDHYDHLDIGSMEALRDHHQQQNWPNPQILAGLGMSEWFEDNDIPNSKDLDWWQSVSYSKDSLQIWAVPVQHWSKRSIWDTHSRLWCGFVIEWQGKRIYFGGDQGYSKDTRDVGEFFEGGMDLALIPIGAYEPRWFMKNYHANPFEAVKMHLELKSKLSIGMHWGTFVLTTEEVSEPPKLLQEALGEEGLSSKDFKVLQHRQSLQLMWNQIPE